MPNFVADLASPPHVRVLLEARDLLRRRLESDLVLLEETKFSLARDTATAEKTQADLSDIEAFLKRAGAL